MRKNRLTKTLTIIVIVLVSLFCLIWALSGPVAKYVINNYGPDLIGRNMSVERVAVTLPVGKVRIEQFEIKESNDSSSFVSFGKLEVQANLWKLLSRTVQVNRIRLDSLDARILQNGAEFNFDDIIAHFKSDSTAQEAPVEESKPWDILLNNIALSQGHLYYFDQPLDAKFGLENINITIPALHFTRHKSDVDLQFGFENGGSLATRLAYNISQGDYSLHLDLDSLNLEILQPYIQQNLNITNFGGELTADLQLNGNLNHIMGFYAQGTVDLADLRADDTQGTQLAKVDNMHIGVKELTLLNRSCLLDTVSMSGAYVRVEMNNAKEINLTQLIKADNDTSVTKATPEAASPKEEEEEKPFAFAIDKLTLAGIAVDFTDHSTHKRFDYTLSDLSLHSNNFNIAGNNNAVISARLNKTGRAYIVWSGAVNNLKDQKLKVNIENVRLADFSPYCHEFTAYPLTGGNMTFNSDNIVSDSHLSSNNHLDIYKSTAGNKDKSFKAEYSNIPVRLGLYLLKDMEEHIMMDIPVKGMLTSPEFSFRKIIFKTIGNAILKVVASPFIFLQGTNGANLHDIPIDALQHTFTTQQYESFNTIVEALKAKPELHISLLQHIDNAPLQEQFEQMALCREYHNSRTEKSTDQLSPIDIERIKQLSYTDAELESFVNKRLIDGGMATDTISTLVEKRHKLYAEAATTHIEQLKTIRNKTILDYITQQGIADSLISVNNTPIDSEYKGKDRYIIEIGFGDETFSLNGDEEPTTL